MKYACAIRVITNPGLLAVNQDVLGIQESSKILKEEKKREGVAPPRKLLTLLLITLSDNTAFTAYVASTVYTAFTPYTADTIQQYMKAYIHSYIAVLIERSVIMAICINRVSLKKELIQC